MNAVDDTSKNLGKGTLAGWREENPSLLVVVLDTNPKSWSELASDITLQEAVAALLICINGHLALSGSSKVAFITANIDSASMLYPKANTSDVYSSFGDKIVNEQGMYRQFREINNVILTELGNYTKGVKKPDIDNSQSCISGALSLALTYIDRTCNDNTEVDLGARVLLLSVSGDLASQYVPIVNCIFAAQKRHVPIDVCKLHGDSVFLQQASDSTEGTYLKVDHPKGLVQYLMGAFSVPPDLRGDVNQATQRDVDFRAACFVTQKVVNIGYVCSICLCIMSETPLDKKCPMCGSPYNPASLEALNKKPVVVAKKKTKKKRIEGNSAASTPS